MAEDASGASAALPYETQLLNSLMDERPDDLEMREAMALLALKATLVMPSRTNPLTEGVNPIVIDHHDIRCVAMFTTGDAAKTVGEVAPYAVVAPGFELARGLAPGLAMLVANGTSSFVLEAPAIQGTLQRIRDVASRATETS